MRARYLGHRRPGPLRHEALRRGRDDLILLGDQRPGRGIRPRRWAARLEQCTGGDGLLVSDHARSLLLAHVGREERAEQRGCDVRVDVLADQVGRVVDDRQADHRRNQGRHGKSERIEFERDGFTFDGHECGDVDQRLHIVGVHVADHRAAVRMAHQDHRAVDALDNIGHGGRVDRGPAQRVLCGHHRVAAAAQVRCDAVPAGAVGEGSVHENHGRQALRSGRGRADTDHRAHGQCRGREQ